MHQTSFHGKTMRARAFLYVFLALTLAACEPTIANRGNILDPDKLADIKVGESTREQVATKLGTPTQVSTSFFDPDVIKQKAVEIRFDDKGTVVAVNDLDLSNATDIDPVDRTTPTYGKDDTFIRQLIGNLSHPTPMKNKQEGQ
jgi:outer membrane protein assembly factor BamE (lipoprotein component of BamABCDE complex)